MSKIFSFCKFAFIVMFFYIGISYSQENKNTSPENKSVLQEKEIIKGCEVDKTTFLYELISEQNNLTRKQSDMLEMHTQYEVRRDSSKSLTPEIIDEANRLLMLGERLNKEVQHFKEQVTKVSYAGEKKYFNNRKGILRFVGSSEIGSNDKISANISAINGDFNLSGIVKGDVLVINGSLFLEPLSYIDGKVILINSKVIREKDAKYNGNIVCGELDRFDEPYNEYSSDNLYSFNFSPSGFKIPGTEFQTGPEFKFNRVQGFYFGMNQQKKYYWSGKRDYSIYGNIGYGFSTHFWEGRINFDKWIGNEFRTEIGGQYHLQTATKDNWIISSEENSMAALFIHEDFQDFYKSTGWNVHFSQYFDKNIRATVHYIDDEHLTMHKNTDYSFFGKDKTYRPNPPIDDGKFKSIVFGVDYITVVGKDLVPNGWNISLQYENTQADYVEKYFGTWDTGPGSHPFKDDSFRRLLIDVRRYQKLSHTDRLNIRLVAGSSENWLPVQKTFDLGGLGTIPSMKFKEEPNGNRMLLANAELILRLFSEEDKFPFEMISNNDLIFFYNAGMVNKVDDKLKLTEGFDLFKFDQFRQDAGIALGFDRGGFRIGASFRLDKSEPARLFIRLQQPF